MSESHGTSGAAAAGNPASVGRGGSGGDGRRGGEPGMDERSQRLLQGGAASRAWADTAARETVRSEPSGNPASATTST